jgi:hypothetical protein
MYIRQTKQGGALNILNAWLDPAASGLTFVFELCHGSELRGELRISSADFGFDGFDDMPSIGSWTRQGAMSLAPWLAQMLPLDGTPLWLSFGTHPDPSGSQISSRRLGATQSRPSGFLPVLSWELNLVPALARPVLRMQGLSVRPLTQHHTLHIAVCCSFATAKQIPLSEPPQETLNRIFNQIPLLPGQELTLHVFADLGLQPLIASLPQQCAPAAVVIYDPSTAVQYGDAQRVTSVTDDHSDLHNPWLLWMRDKLSETGIDAVQFVSHGFVSRGHGALALAESPLHNQDRQWARFVGTREISMLLDQLGAWSAILTSPLGNYSVPGLRILQDELTDYIAGPVMLYEMADDPARTDLRSAYNYIFNSSVLTPPFGRAISLYTHPDWKQPFDNDSEEDIPTRDLIDQFTLAGRLSTAFASSQQIPAWVAAGQRSLERSVAKMSLAGLSGDADTDSTRATRQGKQEALRFTADLFAKFASSKENV